MKEEQEFKYFGLTKKSLFSVVGVVGLFAIILVLSLAQAKFDIALLTSLAFWIDIIEQVGFTFYAMLCGQQMGDDIYRNAMNCAFRLAVIKFRKKFDNLLERGLIISLDDWLEEFKKKKLRRKMENLLLDNNIRQFEVLDLDVTDLPKLSTAHCKNWEETPHRDKYPKITYFLAYSKEQIEIITKCVTGKVKIAHLPSSFFRSATDNASVDMWDRSASRGKRKFWTLFGKYSYKLFALVIVAIVFRGMVVGSSERDTMEVLLNVTSRIGTVIMAFVYGVNLSGILAKEDTMAIEYKTQILYQYDTEVTQGIYKPLSLEEQAKKEFALIEKEREEENGKEETISGLHQASA